MTEENGTRFACVPEEALKDTRLTLSEFKTLAGLYLHADKTSLECRVYVETLMQATAMPSRSVSRAVSGLKNKGWIVSKRTGRANCFKINTEIDDTRPLAYQTCQNGVSDSAVLAHWTCQNGVSTEQTSEQTSEQTIEHKEPPLVPPSEPDPNQPDLFDPAPKPAASVEAEPSVVVASEYTEPPPRKNGRYPACPWEDLFQIWDETMPRGICRNKVQVFRADRTNQRLLTECWRMAMEIQHSKTGNPLYHDTESGLTWWKSFFEYIRKSEFLMGNTGERPFMGLRNQGFRWLLGKDRDRRLNFLKILDGTYHPARTR